MTSSQINEIFDKTSFLHGINAAYIEEMFEKFQSDSNSVPSDWKEFFTAITDNIEKQNNLKASWSKEREVELSNEDLVSAVDGNWSRKSYSEEIQIDNKKQFFQRFQITKKNRFLINDIYVNLEINLDDNKYYLSNFYLKDYNDDEEFDLTYNEITNFQKLTLIVREEFSNFKRE